MHALNRRTNFIILSFDYVDPNAPKKDPTKTTPVKKEGDEDDE